MKGKYANEEEVDETPVYRMGRQGERNANEDGRRKYRVRRHRTYMQQ